MELKPILDDLKKRGRASRQAWPIKELDYWMEQYEKISNWIDKSNNAEGEYFDKPKEAGPDREVAIWEYWCSAIDGWGFPICVRYNGGCDLTSIRNQCLMTALLNAPLYKREVEDYRSELPNEYFYKVHRYSEEVYDAYVFISWCVCLDADPKLIKELAPVIVKPGNDRLVDVILQQYDVDREITNETAIPKIFGQLTKLIDATPENRIKLIERHLDKWAVNTGLLLTRNAIRDTKIRHI